MKACRCIQNGCIHVACITPVPNKWRRRIHVSHSHAKRVEMKVSLHHLLWHRPVNRGETSSPAAMSNQRAMVRPATHSPRPRDVDCAHQSSDVIKRMRGVGAATHPPRIVQGTLIVCITAMLTEPGLNAAVSTTGRNSDLTTMPVRIVRVLYLREYVCL